MNAETLELSHGYKAIVEQDDSPENPWKSWDVVPPILVFNLDNGLLEDYGTGLSLRSVLERIPIRCFGPKKRPEILQSLNLEPEDCHHLIERPYSKARAEEWRDAIMQSLPLPPVGWRAAREFFGNLAFLCSLAKIPCKWGESTGYCQGDAAWVFVAATPGWEKLVGWTSATLKDKEVWLQSDIDLWTAWAWGDVYGYSGIKRPDGSSIHDQHDSCWGFYGRDHETSGLIEAAEDCVEWDLKWLEAERERVFDAACRGIMTKND